MLELLNIIRVFKATDPRDKFFAITSLASDMDAIFADEFIDYNKSLTNIQIELAR